MKRIGLFVFLLYIAALYVPQYAAAQVYPAPTGVFRQEGIGSWYGPGFDGRPTASGEIFDSSQYTAAHPDLPFGTLLLVTNKHNNRQVTVRVNDRGPFVSSRIIDVSRAAAEYLDMIVTGTAPVIIEARQAGYSAAPQYPAYPPAAQPQVVYPPAAQPQAVYPPTAQPQAAYPAPQPQVVYPPAAQQQPTYPAPQPQVIYPPAAQQQQPQAVYPPAAQPQTAYPPVAQYQVPPPAQPQIIIVEPPVPSPAPAVPLSAPDPYFYLPAPPTAPNSYQQMQPEQAPAALPSPQSAPPPAFSPSSGVRFIPAIDPLPGKIYKLQIGSYKDPRSAVSTFEKLRDAGLGPSYERYGDYYRVVLAKVPGTEVLSVAGKLDSAGFREAVIREDNN